MSKEQEWGNLLAEIFDNLTQNLILITSDFEDIEMQGKVKKEWRQASGKYGKRSSEILEKFC